jgi:hypothetical protein
MAELSPTEKHAISHRGRAARGLAQALGIEVREPAGPRGAADAGEPPHVADGAAR